jgi:hypothetical protein
MDKHIRGQVLWLVILSILPIHAVNGSARIGNRRLLRYQRVPGANAVLRGQKEGVLDVRLFVYLMERAIGWANG